MSQPRLIGVVHLPPLPGSVRSITDFKNFRPVELMNQAGHQALQEAKILEKAGFDSVMLENFGDIPFAKGRVSAETIASMSVIACAVKESTKLKVGINVLRNDAMTALGVASVCGCDFIRVNVLSGVVATDQGLIEGRARELILKRAQLNADVMVFADVFVKHAQNLSSNSIGSAVSETFVRGMADAVIVSGDQTGWMVDPEQLSEARQMAKKIKAPLYLGSGASWENIDEWRDQVDGVIVSSCLRKGGIAGQPMDSARVKKFADAFKKTKRKFQKTTKKKKTKRKKATKKKMKKRGKKKRE